MLRPEGGWEDGCSPSGRPVFALARGEATVRSSAIATV
jgi:hypothetical protein